jgi:phytoene dehydrogenase-like protein
LKKPLTIIGGGLSGLAAAIRAARYSSDVLLLEKHSKIGGLNSYYYRNKLLLETGLHAITNYAEVGDKHAPLNRLFRQLKLNRKKFSILPQVCSEVRFAENKSLLFSNDFTRFTEEVSSKFPSSCNGFTQLVNDIDAFDPFTLRPYSSAKKFVFKYLQDELLTDMLLCPLMYYGSSVENDLDLSQFVIMFRSIYQEGMFRPEGTIQTFLQMLLSHYKELGGSIKLSANVKRILHNDKKAYGVELENGEVIESENILSTIGLDETRTLLGISPVPQSQPRLGFVESIFILDHDEEFSLPKDRTIIFYNQDRKFHYSNPGNVADLRSGVICFPWNFQGRKKQKLSEIRSTHLASYDSWLEKFREPGTYKNEKNKVSQASLAILESFVGKFSHRIVYKDTFTPLTIKKYTSKIDGAIYGSPVKIKDGEIGFSNLFLAGTDQGFLGIVGSMLSGVSMVNRHILPKL